MKKSFPLQEALAFCFAAHRINGGYLKNTQRYSEDNPTKHSNKEQSHANLKSCTVEEYDEFKKLNEKYDKKAYFQNFYSNTFLKLPIN